MNLEQMEYITEVSKTQSISLAAQNLHVSQAAVSQSISLLEKELGLKLFTRSRLGTIPTDEGNIIIRKAFEIMKKMGEIKEEAKSITSLYTGELTIAAIPSLFLTLLPKTLSKFKKDCPHVTVSISEMGGKEIIDDIRQHKVDLGLIVLNKESLIDSQETLIFQYLLQGEMRACVHKHSPLALSKKLRVQDLIDYPFVLYSGHNWESAIQQFEKKYGPLNILFTSNNSELIKKTVSEGLAISILSNFMLKDDPYIESENIITIPIIDYKPTPISFGWVYSKSNPRKSNIKKFLHYLHDYVQQL
ncbi:LysR family transcriptional regulator [Bacillus sp. J33]|uniref:LysR family transcriptional regulator n=1 Tax=Bacillus sp. J33 TaxID=935836 RepID=UPI0004796D4A|nr:LysR family transcriptional regulator [Bacillus sp. J33]